MPDENRDHHPNQHRANRIPHSNALEKGIDAWQRIFHDLHLVSSFGLVVQIPSEGCLTFFIQYQFVLAIAVKAQHQNWRFVLVKESGDGDTGA